MAAAGLNTVIYYLTLASMLSNIVSGGSFERKTYTESEIINSDISYFKDGLACVWFKDSKQKSCSPVMHFK